MSFAEKEISNFEGNSIALYEFTVGQKAWYYASSDLPFTIGEGENQKVYLPVGASDGGTTQSGDAQNDDVTIILPRNADFGRLFIGTPPSEEIWATIRRVQQGDADAPIHWIGTVSSVKDDGKSKLEIVCNMLTASFNRNGLRLAWSRQCPHALYDRNCRAPREAFAISLQVESVDGNSVQSVSLGALPDGWLSNGFFEWQIESGLMDRRPIEIHSGAGFTVLGTADGLSAGDWITVYPGCNRTTTHCLDKFNNLSNYGGIPHLPGKSPFDGDPVF